MYILKKPNPITVFLNIDIDFEPVKVPKRFQENINLSSNYLESVLNSLIRALTIY